MDSFQILYYVYAYDVKHWKFENKFILRHGQQSLWLD